MIEKNPISKFDRADFRVAILRRLGSLHRGTAMPRPRLHRRCEAWESRHAYSRKWKETRREGDRLAAAVAERSGTPPPPAQSPYIFFKDDGVVPNHPYWPLIVYRSAPRLPPEFDPAAIFEDLFQRNDWTSSWRNGIYDYVHYHSRIHEVLGIARGSAKVQFGGKRGRTLTIKAGDVAVLPAGTGHQCLGASEDFLVVGAYPPDGSYDECTSSEDHARAVEDIRGVAKPRKDPVYGSRGPLLQLWTDSRRARTMQ